MRTRTAPLPTALPLRFGRSSRTRGELAERRSRFGRGGLLGFLQHDRARIGSRRTGPRPPRTTASGHSAVGLSPFFTSVDTFAPRELRFALLQDCQQRCGDEDRRVRTRGDADEQREREVLQCRTAEDEQGADR